MNSHSYRHDIQGLRAIAVVAVMIFHFNPAWLPGGFIGVDVFLVISGYLITTILLDKKAKLDYSLKNALKSFYFSRFKRIAPAYFLMLVCVSLVGAILFLPSDLSIYKESLWQAALFKSNQFFAVFGDYFAPANHEQPLLHTWSLAVEIQFYVLAPFLILFLPIKVLKWIFLGLLIGLTALAEYRLRVLGLKQATYYGLFARLPEFFAGCLVAIYATSVLRRGSQTWLSCFGLVLIFASAVLHPFLGPFPGFTALVPVAGAVLVLGYPPSGAVAQLLTNKPMVWLGKISFSLYLWHWPVLAFLRYYIGSSVLDMPLSMLFVTLTLLLSTLSFYLVETPLRVDQTRYKQALGYALLTGAVLATSPSMAKINQSLTSTLAVKYTRYADPATICHGQIVGDCLRGDLDSPNEVLVLGDSHAAMLNTFFDQLGKELGFKARIITASSCVTIPYFDYQRITEWAHKPCLEQIEHTKRYLTDAKILFVAANWSWQLEAQEFETVLNNFLSTQSGLGKNVYILGQVPLLSKNPLRALRFKSLGFNPTVDTDNTYKKANAKLRVLVSLCTYCKSLNFEESDIFRKGPFFDGMPIYFDKHHLNEEGAKRYATVAREAFAKIMLTDK